MTTFKKKKRKALVIHDSINYTEMINQQNMISTKF